MSIRRTPPVAPLRRSDPSAAPPGRAPQVEPPPGAAPPVLSVAARLASMREASASCRDDFQRIQIYLPYARDPHVAPMLDGFIDNFVRARDEFQSNYWALIQGSGPLPESVQNEAFELVMAVTTMYATLQQRGIPI